MALQNREKVVSGLTTYLRSLARRRNSRTVTADDAYSYMQRAGVSKSVRERLSVINAALRSPAFESVGQVPSTREVARGRMITEWTVSK